MIYVWKEYNIFLIGIWLIFLFLIIFDNSKKWIVREQIGMGYRDMASADCIICDEN